MYVRWNNTMSTGFNVSNGVRQGGIGETGASCYMGRLLQGCFMQNYLIDGEIAGSCCIRIHQGNH